MKPGNQAPRRKQDMLLPWVCDHGANSDRIACAHPER